MELVPGRTAVVVIDPQNDFLHLDGWYAKSSVDISHMRASIEPTKRLVRAARDRRVPVVWTRHGYRTMRDAGPFIEHRPFLKDGGLRQGTWGYDILAELEPRPDDWVIDKMRLSAFFQSNLELVLRARAPSPPVTPFPSLDLKHERLRSHRCDVASINRVRRQIS